MHAGGLRLLPRRRLTWTKPGLAPARTPFGSQTEGCNSGKEHPSRARTGEFSRKERSNTQA